MCVCVYIYLYVCNIYIYTDTYIYKKHWNKTNDSSSKDHFIYPNIREWQEHMFKTLTMNASARTHTHTHTHTHTYKHTPQIQTDKLYNWLMDNLFQIFKIFNDFHYLIYIYTFIYMPISCRSVFTPNIPL